MIPHLMSPNASILEYLEGAIQSTGHKKGMSLELNLLMPPVKDLLIC